MCTFGQNMVKMHVIYHTLTLFLGICGLIARWESLVRTERQASRCISRDASHRRIEYVT